MEAKCTIVWHVDDRKISHKDLTVIDEIIASLKSEYGKVGEMMVRRGKNTQLPWNDAQLLKDGVFVFNT